MGSNVVHENHMGDLPRKPFDEVILDMREELLMRRLADPEPGFALSPSPYDPPDKFPWYEPEIKPAIPPSTLRLIAFYLPQFHPFNENDRFWGKGFTEWNNVTRALPVYQGHYQPRLPGELGFYDLRLKTVIERQAELALQYGIHGFCYHHYFLDARPVMRTPFNILLQNPDIRIPFCVHWANEPWTIRWDGNRNREGILLDQRHDDNENMAFIQDLFPALCDDRYIQIGKRPLILIYRPSLFPDFRRTSDTWKEFCLSRGLAEPYLVMVKTLFDKEKEPGDFGFDAAVEFPPHLVPRKSVKENLVVHNPHYWGHILDYKAVMEASLKTSRPDYTLFRGIMPQWDNTARNKASTIYHGSSPQLYREWLAALGKYTLENLESDRQFIFINAWNEWAEGAYLEPDRMYGYAWLNATSGALSDLKYRH